MKKFLLIFSMLIIFAIALAFLLLKNTAPQYSGTVSDTNIKDSTEVIYDKYGIPHIYAKSGEDAYFALGYAHAQERLFQMEMLRRLSSGRLAEILGPKLIPIDKKMLSLGFNEFAKKNADAVLESGETEMLSFASAYHKGVNSFIDNGVL
ncbi:MAG: penicillin acylase family protein, partial [Bacteroidetes bacterium 4572_112]